MIFVQNSRLFQVFWPPCINIYITVKAHVFDKFTTSLLKLYLKSGVKDHWILLIAIQVIQVKHTT